MNPIGHSVALKFLAALMQILAQIGHFLLRRFKSEVQQCSIDDMAE